MEALVLSIYLGLRRHSVNSSHWFLVKWLGHIQKRCMVKFTCRSCILTQSSRLYLLGCWNVRHTFHQNLPEELQKQSVLHLTCILLCLQSYNEDAEDATTGVALSTDEEPSVAAAQVATPRGGMGRRRGQKRKSSGGRGRGDTASSPPWSGSRKAARLKAEPDDTEGTILADNLFSMLSSCHCLCRDSVFIGVPHISVGAGSRQQRSARLSRHKNDGDRDEAHVDMALDEQCATEDPRNNSHRESGPTSAAGDIFAPILVNVLQHERSNSGHMLFGRNHVDVTANSVDRCRFA